MENSVEQNTKWMNWNDFNESGEFAKTEKLALNLAFLNLDLACTALYLYYLYDVLNSPIKR